MCINTSVKTAQGCITKAQHTKAEVFFFFFNISCWFEKLELFGCFSLDFVVSEKIFSFSLASLTPWQVWSHKAWIAVQSLMLHSGDALLSWPERFLCARHLSEAPGSPGHSSWGWQHRGGFSLWFVKDSHPEITDMLQFISGLHSDDQLVTSVVKSLFSRLNLSAFLNHLKLV